jgi:hypothetical protein
MVGLALGREKVTGSYQVIRKRRVNKRNSTYMKPRHSPKIVEMAYRERSPTER